MHDDPDASELLMRAARALRRQWLASLEPWRITPHELRALREAVAADGGARLSDVAERLRIAPRSATEVVDALEEKGLVRRAPSPQDRRATLVQPTPAGTRLLEEVGARRAALGEQALAGLDPREVATLRELLGRVVTAAEDAAEGAAQPPSAPRRGDRPDAG